MLGTMGQVCHRESKQSGQEFGQAKEERGLGVAFLESKDWVVDTKLTTQGELHTHPLSLPSAPWMDGSTVDPDLLTLALGRLSCAGVAARLWIRLQCYLAGTRQRCGDEPGPPMLSHLPLLQAPTPWSRLPLSLCLHCHTSLEKPPM